MNVLNQTLLASMQQAAREGQRPTEILGIVGAALALDNFRFPSIVYFKEAFDLPLGEAKQIGAWQGFPGGTWSDDTINEVFDPLLSGWVQSRP